ncbi:hypothetical protein EG328_003446 [Venturia inaequalis]|uniref:Uncharacterized protein n=1 Tax=Venturia inaequalis TaxID=5025 RepID=A0A8H3YZC6_VENIN|nr:hypothetical protein EG328_003446 [Venturia inaequalis]KAE9990149.1 hypothetical protein EG327_001789 [Venturia inaequalis]
MPHASPVPLSHPSIYWESGTHSNSYSIVRPPHILMRHAVQNNAWRVKGAKDE